jgi:putative transposase
MAQPLIRYQQTGNFHTITFSCFHRKPYLGSPAARDLFERSLETMRLRYTFYIAGYVIMPEHVHLLVSEPKEVDLATALGVLKQESGKKLKPSNSEHFWQTRYYDFNVYSEKKRLEKIRYIHRNSVVRGLVDEPEAWPWSSYRHYSTGKQFTVRIESHHTERESLE